MTDFGYALSSKLFSRIVFANCHDDKMTTMMTMTMTIGSTTDDDDNDTMTMMMITMMVRTS